MGARLETRAVFETRFRAMGTGVHIVVVDGPSGLLELGEERIRELERRWSRFLPASEVTALNESAGDPVIVSADTYKLVSNAVTAWRATDGRFDPTVGAALVAHGYDRDFSSVASQPVIVEAHGPAPTPADIDLDPMIHGVTVPAGVLFDPGGLGKGLAADIAARELRGAGAAGALVNVGGDLRATGTPSDADGWVITVPEPADDGTELARLSIPHGAVATTSNLRRRWQTTAGESLHHVIDPRTGSPTNGDIVAVTVVTGEAWWAEVLATSLFLAGPAALTDLEDAHAVIVTANGARHATPGIREALR